VLESLGKKKNVNACGFGALRGGAVHQEKRVTWWRALAHAAAALVAHASGGALFYIARSDIAPPLARNGLVTGWRGRNMTAELSKKVFSTAKHRNIS